MAKKKLKRAYNWLRSMGRAYRVPGDVALLVGLVLAILLLWRW